MDFREFANGLTYSRLQVVNVTHFAVGTPQEQHYLIFSDGITSLMTNEGEIEKADLLEWLNGTV